MVTSCNVSNYEPPGLGDSLIIMEGNTTQVFSQADFKGVQSH